MINYHQARVRLFARSWLLAKANAPDEIAFVKNELSEMLPRPTPLSLSLLESLWASGGSVDLACRSLRLSYKVEDDSPSYVTSILGRLYLNKTEEQGRALKIGPMATRRLTRGAKKQKKTDCCQNADRTERLYRKLRGVGQPCKYALKIDALERPVDQHEQENTDGRPDNGSLTRV